MKLNELSPQQLAQLYRQELTSAFPPEELKPLRSMLSLMEQGRYQALGLYDGEDLVAYALLWLEPGCPFALLDYLGTMAGLRDRGLGSRMLDLLAEHYAHFRGIFGEAEAPENGDPAGEPLRRRRPLRRVRLRPVRRPLPGPDPWGGGCDSGGTAPGPSVHLSPALPAGTLSALHTDPPPARGAAQSPRTLDGRGKGRCFPMNILAIESSCDETAAAVVRDGRTVLSNCVASQIEMHTIYGGVVPEIASRKHVEAVSGLAREALERAGLSREEVDGVAVTYAPGLIGAVLVGVNFAKGAALALDRPLIPVHHVRGHIAANYLTHPDLEPPFVCLCVSGGTTAIVDVRSYTEMEVLGGTRDDAAGECFDKVARVLGIGYPGGAPMDRLADGGDDAKYELPRAHVQGAELDMSFSGLKTACLNLIHNAQQKGDALDLPSFAASFGRAVSESLVPRAMEASRRKGYGRLAVAGGVAANRRIRADLEAACRQSGDRLFLPELKYCGDNAAMIGCQGYYEFLAGRTAGLDLNAYATRDISLG